MLHHIWGLIIRAGTKFCVYYAVPNCKRHLYRLSKCREKFSYILTFLHLPARLMCMHCQQNFDTFRWVYKGAQHGKKWVMPFSYWGLWHAYIEGFLDWVMVSGTIFDTILSILYTEKPARTCCVYGKKPIQLGASITLAVGQSVCSWQEARNYNMHGYSSNYYA